VSPSSLIVVFALSSRVNGYIKQEGYFKLFVIGRDLVLVCESRILAELFCLLAD
jgi:hypothetical protein